MANWLTQEEGIIDHSTRADFRGTQPVRVLTHVLLHFFQNTHNDFFDEILTLIKDGKLNNHIDMQYGEVPIEITDAEKRKFRTPKITIDTKTIQLHESFLSYQWCITYAIYILFLETIDYPMMNAIAGYEKYIVSPQKIEQAKELFAYAKKLIVLYDDWDKEEMPNPEKYLAQNRDYIEQTNIFFTEGMKFILCHEFIHAKKHLDSLPDESCDSCFQQMEYEADNEAAETLLKGAQPTYKFVVEIGIVFGILSMFFFNAKTKGTKHPNAEDRLTNALEGSHLDATNSAWAFACIGLELWDEQFDLQFDWAAKGNVSYKDLYYDVVGQIKARNGAEQAGA